MNVPDVKGRPAKSHTEPCGFTWLLERAEEVFDTGLTLEDALEAVRCGYSSKDADGMTRKDLAEGPVGILIGIWKM